MPKTYCTVLYKKYCSFAGRSLEASWRRCHNSSRFHLSQFVLFLHVIPDRLNEDEIRSLCDGWLSSDSLCKQKFNWIITIKGKIIVWIKSFILTSESQKHTTHTHRHRRENVHSYPPGFISQLVYSIGSGPLLSLSIKIIKCPAVSAWGGGELSR